MQKTEGRIPSLASWDFHTRFFPALLTRKFLPASQFGSDYLSSVLVEDTISRPEYNGHVTRFVPHSFWVSMIFLAIACILTTLILGAVVALLGAGAILPLIGLVLIAGFGYIFYHSIVDAKGTVPSYNDFLFGLFFFSLLLGAVIGLIAAPHDSWWIKALSGALGGAGGYWAGLLIGMHAQRLGSVAIILDGFSLLGTIGISVVAILLLL